MNEGPPQASTFPAPAVTSGVLPGVPLPPPVPDDATNTDTATVAHADDAVRSRLGDLTTPWRAMVGVAWGVSFFAYAAIYQASVQIGISTWWIGPRAQPNAVVLRVLPFFLSLGVALLVIYNVRRLATVSIIGSVAAALIAVPDISRSTGLATAEFIVAALLLIVSVASLTGRYQRARITQSTSSATSAAPGAGPPS